MARLFDTGIFSVNATNGSIGVGYKLYFYTTGTSTPKATYPTRADADAGTNANANPVVAASDGRFAPIWLTDGDYKAILKDFDDVTLETKDPADDDIPGRLASTSGGSLVGLEEGLTVQERFDEIVTVRPTMTTAEIDAVLSGMTNGGTVRFVPGTYTMTANLTGIKSNTHVIGYGAVLDFSGVAYGQRVDVQGSLGTPVSLSSNASSGGSSIVLSSVSGLAAGDALLVYSDALVPLDSIGGSTTETIGEIVTIEAISGTTVSLFEVLDDSYLTADNAAAAKLTPKESVTIEGLKIVGKGEPGDTSSTLEAGIAFKYARNCHVVNCHVQYCDYNGIRLEQDIGCTAIGNTVEFEERGGTSGSVFIQYGIVYLSATRDLTIERNLILGGKHAIVQSENSDPGMSRHIKIVRNIAKQTWAAAFATHESAAAIDFLDNEIEGCARGYDIRVPFVTIKGGNIRGLDPANSIGDGVYLSEDAHDIEISGLWVYGGRYGVRGYDTGFKTGSSPRNINIHDNHFLSIGQRAVYLEMTLAATEIKGLVVAGNTITDFGADGIYLNGPFTRPTVRSNTLECASAPAGYGVRLGGTQKPVVNGNTLLGMVPVRLENDTQGVPVAPTLAMLYGNIWDHTTAFLSQAAGTFTMQQDNVEIGANTATIATGAITVPAGHKSIIVDTEGAAASDDLDTISGTSAGDVIVFRAANDARTVVFKDGTGNLKLSGDFSLDNADDTITLVSDGTNLRQVSNANNGA